MTSRRKSFLRLRHYYHGSERIHAHTSALPDAQPKRDRLHRWVQWKLHVVVEMWKQSTGSKWKQQGSLLHRGLNISAPVELHLNILSRAPCMLPSTNGQPQLVPFIALHGTTLHDLSGAQKPSSGLLEGCQNEGLEIIWV